MRAFLVASLSRRPMSSILHTGHKNDCQANPRAAYLAASILHGAYTIENDKQPALSPVDLTNALQGHKVKPESTAKIRAHHELESLIAIPGELHVHEQLLNQ